MTIIEAIAARTTDKNGITRESWNDSNNKFFIALQPTNSPDCCIICSRVNRSPYRGWQPTLDDLTATDWVPCAAY